MSISEPSTVKGKEKEEVSREEQWKGERREERTPTLRRTLLRLHTRVDMPRHQPLPRDFPSNVNPNALIKQLDRLLPRRDVQESVESFDDHDAMDRENRKGGRSWVFEGVVESRERERGKERLNAQVADEGEVGVGVEGEGGSSASASFGGVLSRGIGEHERAEEKR